MDKPKVQILLSTFNGETYLVEQIESILFQSYKNWQILIRDDGSTDNSLKLIENYCSRYPNQIVQIQGGIGGSSTQSFITLLEYSDAPYIMFCDQDDVWEKDKIKLSLAKLLEIEKENPAALVFTDMVIVDEKLSVQFESFMVHQKLKPEWSRNKNYVFVQSMAAGCTLIFTKLLKEKLRPINATLFQHDHWLLINAAEIGSITYLNQSTVLYRQHQQNSIGSHKIDLPYFYKKCSALNKVFKRWKYIKIQFPNTTLLFLFTAKLKLNFYRIIRSVY